jgi:ABC-type polysaccharide/polyol phosphate export permease
VRRYLFLVRELVKRDFQGRYAGSVLGFVWSLLQPIWLILLYTFVFSVVIKIKLDGELTSHFSIFLFGGLLPWTAINEGVVRSATAITDNSALVKKLRFPPEILVLAVVLAALLHEAIAAVIFVCALLWVGELSWGSLPLLLLALPLQIGLTLGLGLLVASFHVFFRDTAQILGMFFNVWFYLTPIVYPLSLVPSRYRTWLQLNPLTALVGLYRHAFLGGSFEPVPGVLSLALAAAVLTFLGFWLFSRLKPAFVDEI